MQQKIYVCNKKYICYKKYICFLKIQGQISIIFYRFAEVYACGNIRKWLIRESLCKIFRESLYVKVIRKPPLLRIRGASLDTL